jgi:5-methylcytosine-specific restriction endonuclease McrA
LTALPDVAPLGSYYVCKRREEGYTSLCMACKPRVSRVAFEDYREQVITVLEAYCQGRDAPSNSLRAVQMAHTQRYWANKRTGGGKVTAEEWQAIRESYGGKCVYCGSPGTQQDHVVPLSRGGAHAPDNVVPCCQSCNRSKSDKEIMINRQFSLPI